MAVASPTRGAPLTAEPTQILTPAVGVVQRADLNGEVLRNEMFVSKPGYRITQTVSRTVMLHSLTVQAYEPLTRVHSKAVLKACADGYNGACLFDDDGDGTFDRIAEDLGSRPFALPEKVAYEPLKVIDPTSRVVQVISLAAIQPGQLTMRYRERLAQPGAYEADEVITLPVPPSLPAVMAVRQFSIKLLHITQSFIQYVIEPKPAAAP